MARLRENKPTADILMNSMRAIGYSFEAAVADIVDNSISAHAKCIAIRFPIDPLDCYVAICDNGDGMSAEELFDAMKYGSQMKREYRANDDLGRFGLGMKAASLSQCRRLTVASKKNGVIAAYVWDLDVIEKEKDWYIIECSPDQIAQIKHIDYLDDIASGTVVVWENFDLLNRSSGNIYSELCQYQDHTAGYLSLIFHRYLNGECGEALSVKVNHFDLKGLDPFLEGHKKTNARRKVELPMLDSAGIERIVEVQPFVLPFQKDLTAEDKRLSGGIENYRSKQGFYVYRNKRLIVWGTWFGRHRDELTKYARVRVDIPNTLDDIWGIDIKKQTAKIPTIVKNRLTKAVDEAMDIAVKAQTYRGRIEKVNEDIEYIWNRVKGRDNQYTYHINRSSKIFELIRDKVDDETWSRIDMVLEEIENSVPYQQIYIDKSQNRLDDNAADEERLAEVEEKAGILIELAMKMGAEDRNAVIDRLLQSEPFNNYPMLCEKLKEEQE